MQCSYPDYNFPSYPHASTARKMFSNYESGFLNGENTEEFESQRIQSCGTSSRQYLTIPMSNIPIEVPYPWKDRVMGEIIEKNKILESFIARVNRIIGARKRSNKRQELSELITAIENYKENPENGYEGVAMNMPPWFSELLEQYEKIRDIKEPKNHNSRYAGGCLVGFQGSDPDHALLISPSGTDFDNITLHKVIEDSCGIVRSKVIGNKTLPGTVYEIRGQQGQSQKHLLVRVDSSCLMYSVDVANEESPFTLLRETEISTGIPSSISLSPYIPEECLIATDQGQCYMWTGTGCEEVIGSHPPRFASEDKWRSSHFGAHPRQIIFSDPTMVQTYDLRGPASVGHDLFALPNKLLHQKERIRQCESFQECPFYQFIATDYSLLLVDERFPGHVVLKWDHMLSTQPQYLSILDHVTDSKDSVVYVGSQVPSEVHGFRFRVRGDKPPQSVSVPWRADRMRFSPVMCDTVMIRANSVDPDQTAPEGAVRSGPTLFSIPSTSFAPITQWDILKNPTIIENISNVKALETRFNSSLTGIQVLPWQSGHIVLQLDSHGDIFGQLFKDKNRDMQQDEQENPAVQIAKEWVEALESQIKHCFKTNGRSVVKDVRDIFEEIQHMRPVCTSCQLCLPSSNRVEISLSQEEAFCLRCCFTVKEGRQLVEAVEKDTIRPSSMSYDLSKGLVNVDKLPSASALSRLLLKQWNKDTDIENELKDWDREVLEYRKHRRKKKREQRSGTAHSSLTEKSKAAELEQAQPNHSDSSSETDDETENTEKGDTSVNQEQESAGIVQKPFAAASEAASENESDVASQEAEQSAANQETEQSPAISDIASQETESISLSHEMEESSSNQDTAISRTPSRIIPSLNLPNILSGIQSTKGQSRSMYDSETSLFSGSEIASPRKRRRHSSLSSSVSVRSDISRSSVLSFPGFLESPKHLKSNQNAKTWPSIDKALSSRNVTGEVLENLEKRDQPRTAERDVFERFVPDTNFTDIFSKPPSLFRSPVSASISPLNSQGRSPKLKLSMSPSKVRKKGYQPGF